MSEREVTHKVKLVQWNWATKQSLSKHWAFLENQIWHWIWVLGGKLDKVFDLDSCLTQTSHWIHSWCTRNMCSVSAQKGDQFRGPSSNMIAVTKQFRASVKECAHFPPDQSLADVYGRRKLRKLVQNLPGQRRNSTSLEDTNPHLWPPKYNKCPFLCTGWELLLFLQHDIVRCHYWFSKKYSVNPKSLSVFF